MSAKSSLTPSRSAAMRYSVPMWVFSSSTVLMGITSFAPFIKAVQMEVVARRMSITTALQPSC